MTTQPEPVPAVWIDGDPLMEAIAATVWEQCRTDHPSSVVDDPRNIAAVAASVARAQQPAVAPATNHAALRELIIVALKNAHHTHPCPALGDEIWSGCVHYDEAGRVSGVGSCHSGRRADAVLSVLPASADRAVLLRAAALVEDRACDADFTATPDYCAGLRDAAATLRRAADEAGETRP